MGSHANCPGNVILLLHLMSAPQQEMPRKVCLDCGDQVLDSYAGRVVCSFCYEKIDASPIPTATGVENNNAPSSEPFKMAYVYPYCSKKCRKYYQTTQPHLSSYQSFCFICHVPTKNTCSQCRVINYCSLECQAKDWPRHKLTCAKNK